MPVNMETIGVTLFASCGVAFVAILFFGFAVRFRSTNIAPRCSGRHPNVIFNPNADLSSSQFRGNPWLGWIPWVLSLTYETMLKGVPGTGTREEGLSGSMLRVNLDGIVLLRFNSLGLRISVIATFLYLFIVLPVYLTGHCSGDHDDKDDMHLCYVNLTDYSRTTIGNIPPLESVTVTARSFIFARLYVVGFVSWIVTLYACYELEREWVVIQAMRRVFFFECDHWRERRRELETVYGKNEQQAEKRENMDDKLEQILDPWIPDPEYRETVPNIALYSVLVGGLQSLQDEENNWDDDPFWQVHVTKSFFDHCIPNQPGFSSSVAAVTILPGATEIAEAWTKWYTTVSKMRRLKFIRKHIADQGGYVDMDIPGLDGICEFSDFGYEQIAVYNREVAQSAAACCPFGCFEGKTKKASSQELREEEQIVLEELEEANEGLREAQKQISVFQSESGREFHSEFVGLPATVSDKSRDLQIDPSNTEERGTDIDTRERKESEDGLPSNHYETDCSHALAGNHSSKFYERVPYDDPVTHNFSLQSDGDENATWERVISIIEQAEKDSQKSREVADGGFVIPVFHDLLRLGWKTTKHILGWVFCKSKSMKSVKGLAKESTGVVRDLARESTGVVKGLAKESTGVVKRLAKESTYAVVTFTSRQAAVAARQCLVDSRGWNRWLSHEELPIPPLADAAPCYILPCRGCCRPVTVSLNDRQKNLRAVLVWVMLPFFFVFCTVPLTAGQSFLSADRFEELFPKLNSYRDGAAQDLSGLLSASIFTLFFALCPLIFKSIANFEGTATSVPLVELRALQYFWWFMVVTALCNTSLASMVLQGVDTGVAVGSTFDKVLQRIAITIPETTAPAWMNWIIMRFGIVLPLQYLLQMNTFIFERLGWNCCARMTRGGGPGGPVPYRIYVDCGMVLLCVFVLAPVSPLVSPFALIYFIVSVPLLRRNMIFVYKPRYDAGGILWPFLSEMFISCILVSQILLTVMMILRLAYGPAMVTAIPVIPTFFFRRLIRQQFLKAFNDSSLLQTSLLDGWNTALTTSIEKREEFRRFLVDAHKAAYVPVCVAGSIITAEPAVVIPTEDDQIVTTEDDETEDGITPLVTQPTPKNHDTDNESNKPRRCVVEFSSQTSLYDVTTPRSQIGATMRRVSQHHRLIDSEPRRKPASDLAARTRPSLSASEGLRDTAFDFSFNSDGSPKQH